MSDTFFLEKEIGTILGWKYFESNGNLWVLPDDFEWDFAVDRYFTSVNLPAIPDELFMMCFDVGSSCKHPTEYLQYTQDDINTLKLLKQWADRKTHNISLVFAEGCWVCGWMPYHRSINGGVYDLTTRSTEVHKAVYSAFITANIRPETPQDVLNAIRPFLWRGNYYGTN